MEIDKGLMKVYYGSTSHELTKEDSMGIDTNGELECDMLTRCSLSTTEEPPRLRRIALELSLWVNVFVTITKLVAYIQTSSLSVLAALVDSVLDIVSQLVLNYTEKHSSLQRSSAFYPAGASRLEPVGVLTCAALMGMASFEVIKESIECLASGMPSFSDVSMASFWALVGIIVLKLGLLYLCQRASGLKLGTSRQSVQNADPTLEALAQDHWNDALSNGVAALALLVALRNPHLWWVDPVGAVMISLYIIHSWYTTGKEQVEQLTGKAAPTDFLEELQEIANSFDDRMIVDVCRAYHFGPKFLVEIEVVLPKDTLLFESHDLGMELQYEIESREEVERCFVHIDYESRPYDEHVVSKVPELREKYRPTKQSTSSYYSV
jgi:cation diffusion facilitator family transporter